MPSPFPGMDPYLEAHWRDLHARLIIYACDTIQGALPGSLRARVEESVVLEEDEGVSAPPFFPDARIIEYPKKNGPEAASHAGVATAEPVLVGLGPERVTERYLQIIDRASGNRVVTVIEFLSPANKTAGPNREQYLRKQREVCSSDANLVEIDLNRYGRHTLAFPLIHLEGQYRTPYMACVCRATRPDKAEVYPMPLWQRLPTIKIPLRPTDADVPLDLQAIVEQCYRNGAYEDTIDYATNPDPPLLGGDRVWADEHLRGLGLRPPKKPAGKRKPKKR